MLLAVFNQNLYEIIILNRSVRPQFCVQLLHNAKSSKNNDLGLLFKMNKDELIELKRAQQSCQKV